VKSKKFDYFNSFFVSVIWCAEPQNQLWSDPVFEEANEEEELTSFDFPCKGENIKEAIELKEFHHSSSNSNNNNNNNDNNNNSLESSPTFNQISTESPSKSNTNLNSQSTPATYSQVRSTASSTDATNIDAKKSIYLTEICPTVNDELFLKFFSFCGPISRYSIDRF
jgi:hypothetical protein